MRMTKAEKTAANEKMNRLRAEAQQALSNNSCPACGNGVYVNQAIMGWIQCHGYPAASHRRAGHENDAKCGWQGFIS